jgi:hypothetical protein
MKEEIIAALPSLKVGSLCIWGDWFGRPYDNQHQIVGATVDGNYLVLNFNDGETLKLESPTKIELSADVFRVANATRVRWEWYYYGRPKTPENRYFQEYVRNGDQIETTTNVDWYTPQFSTSLESPAAELL